MEYCATCGEPVPEPYYEWEGPVPIGGEPERGWLCEVCGEREEDRWAKERAQELMLDMMLGK